MALLCILQWGRRRPEREVLKLSDAFQVPVKEGKFEWTAVVLNINHGHNQKLLEQCSILGEYGILIGKIREFRQDAQELKEAIVEAIEYCISNDILKEFLLEHKSEVTDMLKMEYDEAKPWHTYGRLLRRRRTGRGGKRNRNKTY